MYICQTIYTQLRISANSTVDDISIPGADNDQGVEHVLYNDTGELLIGINENENWSVHESAIESGLLIYVNDVVTLTSSKCLQITETKINPAEMKSYNYLFQNSLDRSCDNGFVTWCALKRLVVNKMSENMPSHEK